MSMDTYQLRTDFAKKHFAEGEARGKAEGEAEGEAKGKAEGEARGEAQAVLTFLSARGLDVDEHARERIQGCTDLDQLTTWIKRAATIGSTTELFD